MCLPHSLNSTGEPRSANWHSARKAPYTRVPAGRPSHACGVEPIHAADTGPHAARRAPYTRLRSRASATDHPIVRFLPVARSRCAADPRSTESTVHPRGSAATQLAGASAGSRAARRAPYTHPRSRVANPAPGAPTGVEASSARTAPYDIAAPSPSRARWRWPETAGGTESTVHPPALLSQRNPTARSQREGGNERSPQSSRTTRSTEGTVHPRVIWL